MIPTIEDILRDLLSDQIALSKAVALIQTHIDTAIDADGLRDHFAGLAMQGMISKGMDSPSYRNERGVPVISQFAYQYADAMMEARGE